MINALENKPFNDIYLKEIAIRVTFDQGAYYGIKDIIEELHGHPAVTFDIYAIGLSNSWENVGLKIVFPFLLSQADQGDLDEVKRRILQ